MNTLKTGKDGRQRRVGSVLATTVIMLSIAALTIGSVMTATVTYLRHAQETYYREKAAFLADAGLEAALVRLNAYSDGNISYTQSRGYFGETNGFSAPDWGFATHIAVSNGRNRVISVGRYFSRDARVEGEVELGAGSRSIHALYAHALFAGNSSGDSNYVLRVGGWGSGADFVFGDTYSGQDIELSGDSSLRLPEALQTDVDGDGVCDPSVDTWANSYAVDVYSIAMEQVDFDAYVEGMEGDMDQTYGDGVYNLGEPFVDSIGNGLYDVGDPFVDANGNGIRDPGDEFTDLNGNGVRDPGEPFEDNGNGVWDSGEEWTDDSDHSERQNGRYDPAGGFWEATVHRWWRWTWTTWSWETPAYAGDWPPEEFEDTGDGIFYPGEEYTDQNGIYDVGEEFLDDRNSIYDYGTQAPGAISGMPSPGPGQREAVGGDAPIDPPDLVHMYYDRDKDGTMPAEALTRWGHDVAVNADDFSANGHVIADPSAPEHIFVRNVPQSSPGGGNDEYRVTYGGVQVRSRGYEKVYDDNGDPVDDYFLEDATDASYNSYISDESIDGSHYTAPHFINVRSDDNVKLYYVDGNVYLHATPTWSLRFRQPGTRITIVANGNITISDEFYYNADYPAGLDHDDIDSTIVNEPEDALCLIALKNPDCSDSGNIYIGDPAMGTGGSIHAMLYAENDFIDNNINTVDHQFISVFGNMSAGNHVELNRQTGGGYHRTRLDVSLDPRIRDGAIIVPGLPHPVGTQRSIQLDTAWHLVPGTWVSWSFLE